MCGRREALIDGSEIRKKGCEIRWRYGRNPGKRVMLRRAGKEEAAEGLAAPAFTRVRGDGVRRGVTARPLRPMLYRFDRRFPG